MLEEKGRLLQGHGSRHDLYLNPVSGGKQPVPRHADIDDALARHILKYLGLFG